MVRRIKVAVAGLGTMGRQHVRVLSELPDVEIVAVCDVSAEARSWAEGNLSLRATDDWRRLADSSADAIVNALPTPAHFETTLGFLEAGKSVLVEKPIAVTVEEADSLVTRADRDGRLLMVGHVERFNPAVQALRSVIEAGDLGEVVNLSSRRVGVARPVAPHSNVVIDLAIHDIDVCGYLLPAAQGRLVFASAAKLGSNLLEDHADLVIRFGSAVALVQANWITPVKIRRLTVTGTSGLAEVDYLTQTLRMYKGVPEVIQGSIWNFFALAQESAPMDIPIVRTEPLRAELTHFVECVRSGQAPMSDPRDATRALALAVAATDVIRGRA